MRLAGVRQANSEANFTGQFAQAFSIPILPQVLPADFQIRFTHQFASQFPKPFCPHLLPMITENESENPSDTPRTDAHVRQLADFLRHPHWIEFARQLERELAELKAELSFQNRKAQP